MQHILQYFLGHKYHRHWSEVYSFDLTKDHNLGHQESANYHIFDVHNLLAVQIKGKIPSLKNPYKIYRSYKQFNYEVFIQDLDNAELDQQIINDNKDIHNGIVVFYFKKFWLKSIPGIEGGGGGYILVINHFLLFTYSSTHMDSILLHSRFFFLSLAKSDLMFHKGWRSYPY
jgi:hypothetical protein